MSTKSLVDEPDFEAIDKEEVNQVILIFEGFCEGYAMGANLDRQPQIFLRIQSCLNDLQEIYAGNIKP